MAPHGLRLVSLALLVAALAVFFLDSTAAQNCGCSSDLCCSRWGYCGTGSEYCGTGCQEGPCDATPPTNPLSYRTSSRRPSSTASPRGRPRLPREELLLPLRLPPSSRLLPGFRHGGHGGRLQARDRRLLCPRYTRDRS
ncbi:unnamed protein product [Spirodela intermedia]|uniref:Chitin-binding type-1 domain-containing protein n=1 Tax=Spirodela intermedia TaxID=51605 RepID=A0A7I8JC89_SPIIN|nr:unnamed protein product [Spirodela intermedia]CAA6667730.1 unnamed protein product [Spirodela intermedia]